MRHRMAMKMIEEHDSRSEWKDHERERKQMNTDDIRDGLKDCLIDMMRIVHVRRHTDPVDFVFFASPVPTDEKSVFDRAAGAIDLALGLGARFGGSHCFIDTYELKNVLRRYESRDIGFEECRRAIAEILEEECA
jgi:hypothetical protein